MYTWLKQFIDDCEKIIISRIAIMFISFLVTGVGLKIFHIPLLAKLNESGVHIRLSERKQKQIDAYRGIDTATIDINLESE